MKSLLFVILASVLSMSSVASEPHFPLKKPPRLFLVLVFDQFRADYLTRFQNRFLPAAQKGGKLGGFRWLISHGAYFPFAEYDILQSMTGPGHATILSGSYPYQSGVPVNDWYDRATHERMYCAEDRSIATVGANPRDPFVGTSPRNLIATTVGDELKNAGFPSKVVSISLKDRAAIFLGGHRADLAIWFDREAYHWVSSKYYLEDGNLPGWVQKLNSQIASEKGKELNWVLTERGTGFTSEDTAGLGPQFKFPHRTKVGELLAMASPYGIEVTVRAVQAALKEYDFGRSGVPDLLTVSFSSHDYVGHRYGPNSREAEEITVADDRAVSAILNEVKKRVPGGLEDVVVVLTADHGIPPVADWARAGKLDAGKIDQAQLDARIEERLNAKFGKPKNLRWIGFGNEFNFHLDPRALADRDAKPAEVQAVIKSELLQEPWIAHVFTRAEYHLRQLPPAMFERQILHTYFENRSGDVVIIPKPYYMVSGDTVTHMTGYAYDRTVPLVLSGRFFKSETFPAGAHVIDLAPTLSFLAGTVAPSLSEGRVLGEAIRKSELSH